MNSLSVYSFVYVPTILSTGVCLINTLVYLHQFLSFSYMLSFPLPSFSHLLLPIPSLQTSPYFIIYEEDFNETTFMILLPPYVCFTPLSLNSYSHMHTHSVSINCCCWYLHGVFLFSFWLPQLLFPVHSYGLTKWK